MKPKMCLMFFLLNCTVFLFIILLCIVFKCECFIVNNNNTLTITTFILYTNIITIIIINNNYTIKKLHLMVYVVLENIHLRNLNSDNELTLFLHEFC